MRIRFGVPRKDPKISIEAEVTEQQVMTGLAKLWQSIKSRLPFKIEVGKDEGTRPD